MSKPSRGALGEVRRPLNMPIDNKINHRREKFVRVFKDREFFTVTHTEYVTEYSYNFGEL